jgi:hypothetical protein
MLGVAANRAKGLVTALFMASVLGCSSPDPPPPATSCVANLPASCTPLYAPTFDQLYTRTLHPTCAQSGGACHASAGAQGGLVFEDADASYALLLGQKDGRVRVKPNDPACSLLVEHLESSDPSQVMPPGGMLSAAERCDFEQWIRNGAKR